MLAAYRTFLLDLDKEDRRKYVLVVRSIRPENRLEDERQTSEELIKMTQLLNEEFGAVVDYEEMKSMGVSQRAALWMVADVFLSTSVREGLNLLPLEYVYCRRNLPNTGVVVISEFSACSTVLNGSIKVNPFNRRSLADTLAKVVNMTAAECNSRSRRDLDFVCNRSPAQWTQHILNDLLSQISINILNLKNSHRKTLEIGQLDMTHVRNSYQAVVQTPRLKHVGNRVFILDYGGTLLEKERFGIYLKQSLSAIAGRAPNPRMMRALRLLSEDPNNVVVILTGLTRESLGSIFDDYPNITIACSNGLWHSWAPNLCPVNPVTEDDDNNELECLVSVSSGAESDEDLNDANEALLERRRSISSVEATRNSEMNTLNSMLLAGGFHKTGSKEMKNRRWDILQDDVDWEALKEKVLPILTKYTLRTNGSNITYTEPGIGWSFFASEPDYAEKMAEKVAMELDAALVNFDVKIVTQIKGSLEIVPKLLHKVRYISQHCLSIVYIAN
jgi:trehalose-6-phosphatase